MAEAARYIPKIRKQEESIQRQVCSFLRLQYPEVIFRSDYASGMMLSQAQAAKHKSMQSSRGWPDLFIYEPMVRDNKHYCGLALELKKDGETVYLKVGERKGLLTLDSHIQEQALMLQELTRRHYYARFAVGYDEAISIIQWYLSGEPLENTTLF